MFFNELHQRAGWLGRLSTKVWVSQTAGQLGAEQVKKKKSVWNQQIEWKSGQCLARTNPTSTAQGNIRP